MTSLIPAAAARRLDVRPALTETLLRWRLQLGSAELDLATALEADNTDLIEAATATIETLRQGIRHLIEELSL
ncbi:MAG TPA: hypothetical protein VFN79_17945 [Steroidobacteraceae bacterium]|nr:hypothetical protein [Steroidobacteraceae bacterium]